MNILNKLKLGRRLALGFAIIILLACSIGGISILQTEKVREQSDVLLKSYLPEASLITQMDSVMSNIRLAIRSYAMDEKTEYLAEGLKYVASLKDLFRQADGLAVSNANLVTLRNEVRSLTSALNQYENKIIETSNCLQEINIAREQQDHAAEKFSTASQTFIQNQYAAVRMALKTNAAPTELTKIMEILYIMDEVEDAREIIRVANFKFQALNQPKVIETNMVRFDEVQNNLKSVMMKTQDDVGFRLLSTVSQAANEYQQSIKILIAGWKTLQTADAQRTEKANELSSLLGEMFSASSEGTQRFASSTNSNLSQASKITFYGLLLAIVISIVLSLVQTREITKPIHEGVAFAEEISKGNLTRNLAEDRKDELGDLAVSLNRMSANLRAQLDELNGVVKLLSGSSDSMAEAVSVLSSSSSQITTTTAQVVASATETAGAVSETTTTIEEVNQTVQNSTEKAKAVAENAKAVDVVAQNGRKAAENCMEGMKRIQNQMESIGDTIIRLSEQSQAIGEIIASVSDLAEQSNLLAVNAGIEAAKAGEQGKGFTVVAQEVKSLAEQSKQATVQVRSILNDIQKSINAAVMATEQGTKIVEAGATQTNEVTSTLRILAENVNTTAVSSTQIALALQQLHAGMAQVSTAMENIKQASHQNVTGVKQTEAAARNLQSLGGKLGDLIKQNKDLGSKLQQLMQRYRVS